LDNVIEIGRAKFEKKWQKNCAHNRLLYDPQDKTIECRDCGRFIEAFSAFLTLVRNIGAEQQKLKGLREEVMQLREKEMHLLAAKKAESAWRKIKTVPTCPHCKEAIFSNDGFGNNWTNKKHAREARKFKDNSKSI